MTGAPEAKTTFQVSAHEREDSFSDESSQGAAGTAAGHKESWKQRLTKVWGSREDSISDESPHDEHGNESENKGWKQILRKAWDSIEQPSSEDQHSEENSGKDLYPDEISEDNVVTEEGGKESWKKRAMKVLWDSADKPPKERKFLLKLDVFFLSSIMFGYFIKTLNQANVNTAYINGMQEDLHMKGGDLNYVQSLWTAGYIIGQIPSNLILHRVSARFYLGSLELVWCALTFLTLTCTTFRQLCALRFFVGLTESGYFPGVEYLIGSWYSGDEIAKRSTLFAQSGVAASMVTGYLQAAIISGLQHNGLKPYKWLFVFDGVISFPVALYTMFANPNTPETTTSWYFNEQDKKIAVQRRKRIGAKTKKNYNWAAVKRLFSTYHVYIFPFIFLAYNNSCNVSSQPTFQGWLKSKGYSQSDYNVFPTAVNGTGIGFSIIFAWIIDFMRWPTYPFVALFFVCEIIGCILLAVWNISDGAHYFAYFLTGVPTAWGQPMIFTWLNVMLRGDNEKRNLAVVITNNIAYITNAFIPIFTWKASDMPRYFAGWVYTACLSTFGLVMTVTAITLQYRPQKRDKNSGGEEEQQQEVESKDENTLEGGEIEVLGSNSIADSESFKKDPHATTTTVVK